MTRVFLSHASTDKDVARRMAAALAAAGQDVWLDDAALRPGDQIMAAVARAIEDADVVIVLISKASQASTAMETEAALAAGKVLSGRGGVVIPVLLDRSVDLPFALRSFRALEVNDLDADLGALARAVQDSQGNRQPLSEVLRLERDAIEFESRSLDAARAQEVIYRMERWRLLSTTLTVLAAVVAAVLVVSVLVARRDAAVTALSLAAATAALITTLTSTYSVSLRRRELRRLRDRVVLLEGLLVAERSRQDAQ